ncbi:MAG: hypothetical protein IKM79_03460 [Bacteroidales bacterium]|nr:hypothetical protein [Bacteroidales bacterium]
MKNKEGTTMKKFMTDIKTLAALFIAGVAMTACSSDDNFEQPENPTESQVYTLVIQASKGSDTTTRALSLDGTTLNAYWSGTETIEVGQNGVKIGTATAAASADGTTTITATLTSAPDPSSDLNFYLGGYDVTYTGQNGLLTGTGSISEKYDYAMDALGSGTYTVDEINKKVIPGDYEPLEFNAAQQAIIKFTLIDKADGTTKLSPSALTVTDGTSTVSLTGIPATTYTANGSGVLYVAFLAAGSAETITLTARVGDDIYTYTTSSAKTFWCGQYYEITVKMNKILSRVTGSNALSILAGGYTAISADKAAALAKECWTVAGNTVCVVYNASADPSFSVSYVYTSDGTNTKIGYASNMTDLATLYGGGNTAWIVEPYAMAANATAADKGKLICTAGHIHAYKADADCTAARVAKIIYVGSDMCEDAPYNHGLALAMSDANSGNKCFWATSIPEENEGNEHEYTNMNKNNFATESGLQYNDESHNSSTHPAFQAAISNNSTTKPTGCSDWFLPTGYQFNQMINAAGSLDNLINGFSSVGGTNMQSSSDSYYWVATEYHRANAWLYKTGSGNYMNLQVETTPGWYNKGKKLNNLVRSAIAF